MNDSIRYWTPLATSAVLAAPHLSVSQLYPALAFVAALAAWEAWASKAKAPPASKTRRPLRVVASWTDSPSSDSGTTGAPASKYKGTIWLAQVGKWRALHPAGLSQFDTEEEAARAYDRARAERGLARLNFPDGGGLVPEFAPRAPAESPSAPIKRRPGRPRGKFGPGARAAIQLSRDQGIQEGIAIGLARASATASCK